MNVQQASAHGLMVRLNEMLLRWVACLSMRLIGIEVETEIR